MDAAEALTEQGGFDEAGAMLHAAIEEAHELSDRVLEATAQIQELELLYTVDPEAVEPTIVGEVDAHLPELEAVEAHDGLARAWRLIMFVREMGLQWGAAEEAAQRTLQYARLAGNKLVVGPRDQHARLLRLEWARRPCWRRSNAAASCWMTSAATGRRRRSLDASLSHLEAMRGNVDESRSLYRGSRAKLEELGWTFLAAQTSFDSDPVEMLNGDLATAEAELRRDYETLERMGETNYISTTAAILAEVLYPGKATWTARRSTRRSARSWRPDDVTSQFRWRSVRAKVLAARGDGETARHSRARPSG